MCTKLVTNYLFYLLATQIDVSRKKYNLNNWDKI